MFGKELKYRILSVIFLFITAGILMMVYSSVVPKKWHMYAEPLSFEKYAYIELRSAYETETIKVYQSANNGQIVTKISLNQTERNKILLILRQLNPSYTENEKLSKVKIVLSEEEVKNIIRELELSLGGSLGDYIMENSYIEEQYEDYLSDRIDICTNPTIDEQLDEIEDNIGSYVSMEQYPVFQWGIGPEYPMFFGYCKYVDFTEKQIWDIWEILQQMIEERRDMDSAAALQYYNQILDNIDNMLGGDTIFSKENRGVTSSRKNTLEEEQLVFNEILYKERYTNPYARYLCDYLGVVAGILPVLYAAFLFGRDRKERVQEFIMVSPQRSSAIVGKRMLSVAVVFFGWFYLIAAAATAYFAYVAYRFGYEMDMFAFFKYVTVWIVPTVLFAVSLSVFLDLLFKSSMLVVLVQIVVFFVSIKDLMGGYTLWKPIIRFNAIGRYDLYEEGKYVIYANRGCIFIASLLLFFGAVLLYERRRQGKQLFPEGNKNVFRKSRLVSWFLGRWNHKLSIKPVSKECPLHSWLYYQLKGTFMRSFLLGLAFAGFVGVLFQGFGRDLEQLKRIGENYLSLSSIFLFVPLCNIEKETNVYEVMCVQRKAYVSIYLLRVFVACILLGVVLAVPLAFFAVRFGYEPGSWYLGIYISALFLGLLGLLVGEKLGSRRIGIAAILGYYVLCVSLKDKFRWLSICGYTYQIPNTKYHLLAGCIVEMVLLMGLMLYRSYAKRRRI